MANVRRLEILYKAVEAYKGILDMDGWKTDLPGGSECGYAFCAGGIACELPEFQAEGLGWTPNSNEPLFGMLKSFGALCSFFNISYDKAEYIFFPEAYFERDDDEGQIRLIHREITKEEVLEHIAQVMQGLVR